MCIELAKWMNQTELAEKLSRPKHSRKLVEERVLLQESVQTNRLWTNKRRRRRLQNESHQPRDRFTLPLIEWKQTRLDGLGHLECAWMLLVATMGHELLQEQQPSPTIEELKRWETSKLWESKIWWSHWLQLSSDETLREHFSMLNSTWLYGCSQGTSWACQTGAVGLASGMASWPNDQHQMRSTCDPLR